ncbi:MAG: DUF1080 domain-containing protein [Planctomycetaceae bacterium]
MQYLNAFLLSSILVTTLVCMQDNDEQPDVQPKGKNLAILPEPKFRDLFNGKDLTGWVNVNTDKDTWTVRDSMIVCTGLPIGVMRTDRQYENFILEIEWRHMEPGGNSGVFLWSDANPSGNRLPRGMEVQMLELDWVRQHRYKDGRYPPVAYVQGELFGAGGMTATPANPRGTRSKSVEHRCKGVGQWNKYTVVAVDGTVKLAINGKFVNSISNASEKKGYICLESEGKEIHMRNIRIMELPAGTADEKTTAPLLQDSTKN